MSERDRSQIRAQMDKEKKLRRAQKRSEKHAQKRAVPTRIQSIRTPHGLRETGLLLGLAGADYFSRMYKVHGIELLSSYGHDVLAIPIWWLATSGVFSRLDFFRSKKNILLPVALSVGFETMEYIVSNKAPEVLEQHLLGSARFDPWDFAAYGVGAAAALGLRRLICGNLSSPNQDSPKV